MIKAFLNSKFIIPVITGIVIIGIIHISYNRGYASAESEYKQKLYEFSLKAEKLRTIEEKISKEIVVEYRDKVEVITEKEIIILSQTDDALKNEISECKIGPNFIRLHNEAASK